MAKTFDELIKGSSKNEKEETLPEIIIQKTEIEEEPDELGCLLCSIMEALGHPKSMFKDYKASRIPGILGGDTEVIISMGGPEIAYSEDNMLDIFKDIVKMVDSKKEYTKEDISEIRKDKKKQGASLKKLLALMDDDHIVKAFHGMRLFKSGGEIEFAKEGTKVKEVVSGDIVTLPDDLTDDQKDGKAPIRTTKGDVFMQGEGKVIYRLNLKKPIGLKEEGGEVELPDNTIEAKIGDNTYYLYEAKTEEEKEKGLMGIESLPKNLGMIFYYDKPLKLLFWMKDTKIPLLIVFVNEDFEVISIQEGKPESEDLIECDDAQFVVELNLDADVSLGDELNLPGDDDEYVMQIIGSDGSVLGSLYSGERILSRIATRTLIKKVKRAIKAKSVSDIEYEKKAISVGKYIFKELDAQDGRDAEYVLLDN